MKVKFQQRVWQQARLCCFGAYIMYVDKVLYGYVFWNHTKLVGHFNYVC